MPDTFEPSDRWRPLRSRTAVVAAAFLAGVVVLGIVVAITANPGGGADHRRTDDSGHKPDRKPADGPNGDCPAFAHSPAQEPSTVPKGMDWKIHETFALPVSKTSGPARTNGDVARCYAHTPTGALLAAYQISVRYAWMPKWRDVVEKQTVGAGKASYIKKRAKAGTEAPDPSEHGQAAGYKFVTYAKDTAVIQCVDRFQGGQLQVSNYTVKWSDGDWKLEIPKNPAPPSSIDSLAGYTEWGGV